MPIPTPTLERPRLLATPDTWADLRDRRRQDAALDKFLAAVEADARALLEAPPCTYEKIGRRLLYTSRRVFRRLTFLGLMGKLTGDSAFAKRAEAEMLAVAAFGDWNPSHFLDTAEMMAGMAIGYDWLYDELAPESRATIRQAIVNKGLKEVWPGGKPHYFVNNRNNWNQVCLAGSALAALAVWDEEPELARKTLELAPQFNHNGQEAYAPAGVYPEGPMYWSYGTSFEVVLIAALRRAFGTDFELSKSRGFMESAGAHLQVTGSSGEYFNFSDCRERGGLEPALFWFAKELNQPALLQFQRAHLERWSDPKRKRDVQERESRLHPLMALWWPEMRPGGAELPLNWFGEGPNPIAVFRSSWTDPQAYYLAIKGGSASLSHAHMDAGSFVYESQGVRWAHDLGMQEYESLESKGVNMWNRGQGGQGWQVFRLGPFSHNTVTIDGQEHRVSANAKLSAKTEGPEYSATVDMTSTLAAGAKAAKREFWLKEDWVRVSDSLSGMAPGSKLRWALLTRAEASIEGPVVHLQQEGKQLWLGFDCEVEVEILYAPAVGAQAYDAANPGFFLVTAVVTAPASGVVELNATFGATKAVVKGV